MSKNNVTAYARKQARRFFCAPEEILKDVVSAITTGSAIHKNNPDPETSRYICQSAEGLTVARWNPETQRLVDVYPA